MDSLEQAADSERLEPLQTEDAVASVEAEVHAALILGLVQPHSVILRYPDTMPPWAPSWFLSWGGGSPLPLPPLPID